MPITAIAKAPRRVPVMSGSWDWFSRVVMGSSSVAWDRPASVPGSEKVRNTGRARPPRSLSGRTSQIARSVYRPSPTPRNARPWSSTGPARNLTHLEPSAPAWGARLATRHSRGTPRTPVWYILRRGPIPWSRGGGRRDADPAPEEAPARQLARAPQARAAGLPGRVRGRAGPRPWAGPPWAHDPRGRHGRGPGAADRAPLRPRPLRLRGAHHPPGLEETGSGAGRAAPIPSGGLAKPGRAES